MSKSTRKRIHQSREEVEELKDRLAKIEGAQSQDQDLETSQTAVAKLKEIITQMKQERAAETQSTRRQSQTTCNSSTAGAI
jgi:hypothetical protein